ncbi:MAG TPA: MaoC family dehydratase [Roseiarcus sp.]|nr:MaoC family dehydratase [Roseiarcus sp.]
MDRLYFEDFPVGQIRQYGDFEVNTLRIKAFAEQFDPQPFHLDERAAQATMAGGLIASGWHTAVMLHRMNYDGFLKRMASQGGLGVEEIKWTRPVRPGDRLTAKCTIAAARPSKSRPGLGIVDFAFEVFNQKGETVMTETLIALVERRPVAEGAAR